MIFLLYGLVAFWVLTVAWFFAEWGWDEWRFRCDEKRLQALVERDPLERLWRL